MDRAKPLAGEEMYEKYTNLQKKTSNIKTYKIKTYTKEDHSHEHIF